MMRRLAVRLTMVMALALAASCGSDSSTGLSVASMTGTWDLVSLNGSALPAVVQASGPRIELLHDQITFAANGSFSETYSARLTTGTAVTTESGVDAGTYSLAGSTASMVYQDQSSQTGTVSGNRLTIVGGSFTQVYQKQ